MNVTKLRCVLFCQPVNYWKLACHLFLRNSDLCSCCPLLFLWHQKLRDSRLKQGDASEHDSVRCRQSKQNVSQWKQQRLGLFEKKAKHFLRVCLYPIPPMLVLCCQTAHWQHSTHTPLPPCLSRAVLHFLFCLCGGLAKTHCNLLQIPCHCLRIPFTHDLTQR